MMRYIIILALSICCISGASAQNTLRRNLRPIEVETEMDTTRLTASNIRITGYDKTRTATVESMLITNCLSDTVSAVRLTITYYDSRGRQIHRRTEKLNIEIAPGETIVKNIRAWDRQQQWYYRRSQQNTRSTRGTPFDVKIRVEGVEH